MHRLPPRVSPVVPVQIILISALLCQGALANGWEHTSIDFDVLETALDDANPELRRRAAESLGFRQHEGAVEVLLTRLGKNETVAHVRQHIFESLGRLGDAAALPAIGGCLRDETAIEVRVECAGALAGIDSPEAERLALYGAGDPSRSVRLRAIDSLGHFSGKAALQALIEMAGDEDYRIRNTALLALGRTRSSQAVPILLGSLENSRDRGQTLQSLRALTLLGAPETADEIRKFYSRNADEEIRRHALVALASTAAAGSSAYFLDALSSEDPETQILGLAVLRFTEISSMAPAVVERALRQSAPLFEADDEQLVRDPLQTLADLHLLNEYLKTIIRLAPETGAALYLRAVRPRALPRDSTIGLKIAQELYQARWYSLYGLGYTADDGAGDAIRKSLRDGDQRIRAVATRSLGVLGNPAYSRSIEAMLEDEAAEVRWVAARVLGRSNAASAVDGLLEALADADSRVRIEAAFALGYLDAAAARQPLSDLAERDSDARVREAARYAASIID